MLKMGGSIPALLHTPSWCLYRQLYSSILSTAHNASACKENTDTCIRTLVLIGEDVSDFGTLGSEDM